MSVYFKACSFSLVAILLFLALFGTVGNGLRLDGVRALKQSVSTVFVGRVSGTLPAVQFAARPTARTQSANKNRKFLVENQELPPLSGLDNKLIPVLNETEHLINSAIGTEKDVIRLQLTGQNDAPLAMQARTRIGCWFTAHGTRFHAPDSISARARRQGLTSENAEKSANNIVIVKLRKEREA